MTPSVQERPTLAAMVVQAMQDHGRVRRHRRKCQTDRLRRTLSALASGRA